MAYTFADFPELAFAMPFENLSFERWDATLPDQWAQLASPNGTRTKYNPGFDSTRALKIADSGVIMSGPLNVLRQSITLPSYILNGQKVRGGMAAINSLGSPNGNSRAAIAVSQNTWAYHPINHQYPPTVSTAWQLCRYDSTNDINTSYTDIGIQLKIYSYDAGQSDPAALYDCVFVEYGRTIAERYYTFTRKPEFSGLDVFAETFIQNERTGRAKRRTWDASGGAVKWSIVMPFVNIPGAMVDALYEFFRRNKGLDDKEGVHLVLHHKLIDTADAYNLHIPPWIVCDIAEERWPFKYSGGFLGAKLFSGTLTFAEV